VNQVIVISGASSGFGALTARALADAGHNVYAGMRNTTSRNADAVTQFSRYAASRHVELKPVEMDVSSKESVDAAITSIVEEQGRLDVVVHNAGHMVTGPAEAFTPEEVDDIYDTNVLGTQRVNRAALPHLRTQGSGLLVWVSSTSVKGGTPPYLGPYFPAKAAMDSLAVTYAAELARFGIDTMIIVPGSYTHGTNHFAHAGHAADADIVAAYDVHYQGLLTDVAKRLADLAPADADTGEVAAAIVSAVDSPPGKRPVGDRLSGICRTKSSSALTSAWR
jgi:NAD(P)-dependent dehydrogenase (short-subunit alcohol dehydrogenase family)